MARLLPRQADRDTGDRSARSRFGEEGTAVTNVLVLSLWIPLIFMVVQFAFFEMASHAMRAAAQEGANLAAQTRSSGFAEYYLHGIADKLVGGVATNVTTQIEGGGGTGSSYIAVVSGQITPVLDFGFTIHTSATASAVVQPN